MKNNGSAGSLALPGPCRVWTPNPLGGLETPAKKGEKRRVPSSSFVPVCGGQPSPAEVLHGEYGIEGC